MSLFDASEYEVPADEPEVEVEVEGVGDEDSVGDSGAVEARDSDDDSGAVEAGDSADDSGAVEDSVGVEADAGVEDSAGVGVEAVEPASADVGSSSGGAPRPEKAEPAPDPDALWAPVVGQYRALDQLRASVIKPVHAYLFVGPAGVGKRAAALAFSAALLCPRGGCGTCGVCVRVLASIHPDVTTVEREGASISVDQARDIIRLASRAPVEGPRQVLVLIDFHLVMHAGATLLKIIEEPPPSTIFVILADHLPPELITIASRCVQVSFDALPPPVICEALVREGVEPERAARAAASAGGRLDRARLLAVDDFVEQRRTFWAELPDRLDGTGAAVATLATEAIALVDSAAVGPLEARQAAELKVLEERVEAMGGGRGTIGLRKDLVERHKRELKRLRDDELRSGLAALQGSYRPALVGSAPDKAAQAVRAIETIGDANEMLIRNPNLTLLLQALLLRIGPA